MSSESNKQVAGSHTPEPWSQYLWNGSNAGSHVMDSDGKTIALVMRDNDKANARRIVACVNALAHVTTEELESGKLQSMVQRAADAEKQRDQLATKVADLELALFAENQKRQEVEQQRDQLRGALELMLELAPEPPEANCSCHLSPPCNDCIEYGVEREAFESAKDAIAAVKSGA